MKELQINPSGLLGLVLKIDEELQNGKTQDEILSEYPISKVSLPYLLTLVREFSVLVLDLTKEYGELEQENISLKEQIKALESKNSSSSSKDTLDLKNRLKTLENENNELKEKITDLQNTLEEYEKHLSLYESFFENSSICSIFYNNFLKKANYVR